MKELHIYKCIAEAGEDGIEYGDLLKKMQELGITNRMAVHGDLVNLINCYGFLHGIVKATFTGKGTFYRTC